MTETNNEFKYELDFDFDESITRPHVINEVEEFCEAYSEQHTGYITSTDPEPRKFMKNIKYELTGDFITMTLTTSRKLTDEQLADLLEDMKSEEFNQLCRDFYEEFEFNSIGLFSDEFTCIS